MYGAGGGGGGYSSGVPANTSGGDGFQGVVIVRYLVSAGITATGGQETVTP
jgi:hypothetical protein